ncbi:hypothetical protein [Roseobacter litoralis]|uniref:hypothetical protein n=1 Tax=Roseobacter litoralis TaxID=42443 RepID=UPI00248FFC14|nr:hypothetical protein [Roseobacter litoralis]
MTGQLHIYVVERNLFVSQDMVLTLNAVLPSAVCSVFTNVAEARSASNQERDPQLVLVSANVDGTFSVSPEDAEWLVNRRVIAFDANDQASTWGWVYLNKPFSQEELTQAVVSLLSDEVNKPGDATSGQPAARTD